MVCPRVLDVPAQKRYLVADFYDAAFPGKGGDDARPFYVIQIDCVVPRLDALLINFPAVADDSVTDCIGQVQQVFATVRVAQCFNEVSKEQAVPLVPEFLRCICAFFL